MTRNHSGERIRTTARPVHCTSKAAATSEPTTHHATARARAGRTNDTRRRRLKRHTEPRPSAWKRAMATVWAHPPTKKNSGITWRSQVARYKPEVKPMGFEAWGPSSCQTTTVKTQCHSTTTTRLAPRTRSTKGSRSVEIGSSCGIRPPRSGGRGRR
jgi:hypothetical protein